MQEEFLRHNLFVKGLDDFRENDPHLSALKSLAFVHPLDWWSVIRWDTPGIYILTGGRQIGKTTSTKLLIRHLMERRLFQPSEIFYLPCDQIDDHHHLGRILRLFLEERSPSAGRFLVVLDEVTFVKEWDRAVKALADEGTFRRGFCVITGSDSVVLKEAASRFPGRRGPAGTTDFHLHPLSFYEYVHLTHPSLLKAPENHVPDFFKSFETYSTCGGYLRAINDLHAGGEILKATYMTFEQWIRGDFERRGKSSATLLTILKTLLESIGTQVTYSSLAHKTGQVVKETFIDYVSLLERMDILFTLQAFDQNTKLGFPKKARKIHFWDPFILETIQRWLAAERYITSNDLSAVKAESVVAANYRRFLPTYYLKGEGEIDVIVVQQRRFIPLEVKWSTNVRPHDLKQLRKYRESVILTRHTVQGAIEGVPSIPLPLFLVSHPQSL